MPTTRGRLRTATSRNGQLCRQQRARTKSRLTANAGARSWPSERKHTDLDRSAMSHPYFNVMFVEFRVALQEASRFNLHCLRILRGYSRLDYFQFRIRFFTPWCPVSDTPSLAGSPMSYTAIPYYTCSQFIVKKNVNFVDLYTFVTH
jgi:hypothetical protein